MTLDVDPEALRLAAARSLAHYTLSRHNVDRGRRLHAAMVLADDPNDVDEVREIMAGRKNPAEAARPRREGG